MKIRKRMVPYAYIFPIVSILFVFVGLSLLLGIVYGCTKYNLIAEPRWIGLANYKKMLVDKKLYQVLWNTLCMVVLVVCLQMSASISLALLLAKRRNTRLGKLAKAAIFIPVLSSNAVVGTVWKAILNGNSPVVDSVFGFFHIEHTMLLGSSKTALITVVCIFVWKNLGYYVILTLAARLSISEQYYEAAKMDGANAFCLLKCMTLPMLKPTILLNTCLSIASGIQMFDLVYTLTGGGPSMSTTTIVMYLYNLTFKNGKAGYAMAVSNLLFLLIIGIMIMQRGAMKKEVSEL